MVDLIIGCLKLFLTLHWYKIINICELSLILSRITFLSVTSVCSIVSRSCFCIFNKLSLDLELICYWIFPLKLWSRLKMTKLWEEKKTWISVIFGLSILWWNHHFLINNKTISKKGFHFFPEVKSDLNGLNIALTNG